jgi:hypothetical protein
MPSLLISCTTTKNCSTAFPVQRLTIIQKPDCSNMTYATCLLEYDVRLEQSNEDKKAIIEIINN